MEKVGGHKKAHEQSEHISTHVCFSSVHNFDILISIE